LVDLEIAGIDRKGHLEDLRSENWNIAIINTMMASMFTFHTGVFMVVTCEQEQGTILSFM
jgi:hypothetical protein